MDEVDRIGVELGRDASGVVTTSQLRGAGADVSVVPRLVRSGRWARLWRGTYVCAPGPVGPLTRAHAAVVHVVQRPTADRARPQPVVTGLAGARALGLRWVPDDRRVQVLVGADVRRRSHDGVLVRRAADVATVATWDWGGVPVAEAARLVVDGARECRSLRDVRGLVLGAVADRWTSPEEVLDLLDAGAVGGTAWARRAALDARRGAASPPEAELVDGLGGGGLPYYANAEVHLGGRLVAVLDVYLDGTGVGAEVDSVERHGGAESLGDTLERHERITSAGLSLVHVTPQRYRADPAAFHARLLRAVDERQARGLAEPPGLLVVPRGPRLQ